MILRKNYGGNGGGGVEVLVREEYACPRVGSGLSFLDPLSTGERKRFGWSDFLGYRSELKISKLCQIFAKNHQIWLRLDRICRDLVKSQRDQAELDEISLDLNEISKRIGRISKGPHHISMRSRWISKR